jgi:3-oxoacyl-[acyl-carrier protein] reductase
MDAFETTWRINTGSGILLTQLCLPHMEEQGWGRVIFCSSVAGFTGGIVGPHYASSKSALHGFVHWLAGNVAKKGITVNAVAPALIGGTVMMGDGEEVEQRAAQSKLGGSKL